MLECGCLSSFAARMQEATAVHYVIRQMRMLLEFFIINWHLYLSIGVFTLEYRFAPSKFCHINDPARFAPCNFCLRKVIVQNCGSLATRISPLSFENQQIHSIRTVHQKDIFLLIRSLRLLY